jgi:hypothetical protein
VINILIVLGCHWRAREVKSYCFFLLF